uniref:Caspase family p10 domain-containing protein n=1 Tax=Romanomermis culicivorax TaxID=13658 RepID=A0A915IDI9_ROMCU
MLKFASFIRGHHLFEGAFYSNKYGYVSWRNSMHGSWFIQAICQVFAKKARTDEILHLFTEVNNIVAKKVSSSQHVQIPEPCSRLRKKFYFFPGVDVTKVRL